MSMMLNKIFAIMLFGFGLFISYEGLFNGCQGTWSTIWRISLGLLLIGGGVVLANIEKFHSDDLDFIHWDE